MSNMKKKTKAFTLAEALILLLIAALIAAALVPVITRKHRDVAEHGKWICTLNSQGQHVIKTIYRGKTSDFKVAANDECIFTPPANAKDFTLRAVGGGGGGAGGTAGDFESVYNSLSEGASGTFADTVDTDGYYTLIVTGSGGGGGGMACGEAKEQTTAQGLDLSKLKNFINESSDHHLMGVPTESDTAGGYGHGWHEDWSWDMEQQKYDPEGRNPYPGSCELSGDIDVDCSKSEASKSEDPYRREDMGEYGYRYGYFDMPLDGFEYNLLFQNDKRFTDKYEHGTETQGNGEDPKVKFTDEKGQWSSENGGLISVYQFKYKYFPFDALGDTESQLKNKGICFAEPDWPMSKEITEQDYKGLYLSDMDSEKPNVKCWNLPGEGGKAGNKINEKVEVKAGQSIYVTVGLPGKGQKNAASTRTVGLFMPNSDFSDLTMKNLSIEDGIDGLAGEDTTVNIGTKDKTATGGAGGASRQLVHIPYFINIPVMECEVGRGQENYPNDTRCPSRVDIASECHINDPDDCEPVYQNPCTGSDWVTHCTTDEEGNESCSKNWECVEWNDPHYTCETGSHPGSYYYNSGCVQAVRPKYFEDIKYNINYCAYTAEIKNHPAQNGSAFILDYATTENYWTGLDYPVFNEPVEKYVSTDTEDGEDYDIAAMFDRQRYQGDPGSGGYGAGEQVKSYVAVDDSANSYGVFYGEDGSEGYVSIIKSSAYGGSGGEAGQYVSSMTKKIGKLKIEIGRAGKPGEVSVDGSKGGDTKIYSMDDLNTPMYLLIGGKGGQARKINAATSENVVAGTDGAISPVENESNRAKVVPRGGKTEGNSSYNGQSASIFGTWNPLQAPVSVIGVASSGLEVLPGHPLDTTYGAGGGGGAGGSNQLAGSGGAGTPGVVIIEW